MVDDPKQGGEELHHTPEKAKSLFAQREEEVLAFWNKEKIFEKSLARPAPKGEYVFYDGPPFANGLPHYGHILASTIKDTIPRYRTMQGWRVARQWGWDCHGLPVENLVEKELGFKTKRDIEQYGVANFNEAARTSIMKDVADWQRIIPRLGRWVDMERDYKTMDSTYTESVWWAFKNLYQRGLVYEGFKSMHLCPRCGTTLSNFEVAQGYQDIDDYAVTVKLRLIDEPGTSLLIWTTTPWTLPGNTAAAVNKDAVYVKVKVDEEFFIVAKERLESLNLTPQASTEHLSKKSSGEFLGKELVGKRYEPPFDYFKNELHKHKTHAFRVYAAPYVTVDSGTGIVHLAPAYGAEDLELAQKEKIPLIHHVTDEGKFVATVADFAHVPVKPKGRHRETDAKIIENLKQRDLLFDVEKINHSYPHCWRCDTPLLNWAANSWFVNVQKIKDKVVAENAKVSWVPEHIGEGRFGKWLEGARDWAVSRSRFWGAPIPAWRHSKTKEVKIIGSVGELLSLVRRSGNKYFVMRHGEARSNVERRDDWDGDPSNHLTEAGTATVLQRALRLKRAKIDLVVVSPFLRTRETAAIVQKELHLPDSAVMVDERLRESSADNAAEVRPRVGEFLFELERRYTNKKILIISHGYPLWALQQVAIPKQSAAFTEADMLIPAQVEALPFVPYPHNAHYELDLHRPYIDEVPLGDSMRGEWKRVPDVFDCWFESGAMPFASKHYPFAKNLFNPKRLFGFAPRGYPADFIAEGLDQTRGWFYSLIVLGTTLFGKSPYKQVIVNGLILASDGQKMSKRLRNYPDPMELVEKYGADALRYYLLSSSVIRGEDLRFNERGVEEVSKKLLMRLDNVRSFYELYAGAATKPTDSGYASSQAEAKVLEKNPGGGGRPAQRDGDKDFLKEAFAQAHALDRWIFSRLDEMIAESTQGFEKYELDVATRPLASFIDDLSTWYVRRSRDRFKAGGDDKMQALATLRFVLHTTAQVMAPVMPFFAEDLYQKVKGPGDPASVHLTKWPASGAVDGQLLENMQGVRAICSQALELREKANIKIRQPLASLAAPTAFDDELAALLRDEINVKKIIYDASQKAPVILDTTLTPELKEEGVVRDITRAVQEWRKQNNFTIADRPILALSMLALSPEQQEVARRNKTTLIEATGLKNLNIDA